MKRADTMLGAMMIACASAGSLIPSLTDIVIFTDCACGSMDSTRPTGTPTMRTSSPGYNPTAVVKYPISFWPARPGQIR